MLQYNWNITACVYNSCSAESATVTVKSGSVKQASSRPRSSPGGCWTHHMDTNPSQHDCMALMRWPLNISPSWGQWGLVVNVVWTGGDVGTGPNAETAVWKKYSWKRTKTIYCSACGLLARGNPWSSLTNLAADSQQRVQNHDGRQRSHGHHLGVVTDNGPEGEHQYRAWDQDGDYNQRPVQPFKRNYPQNLQRKRSQRRFLVKSVLVH